MAKEFERAGILSVHITAMIDISQTGGAPRIVPGVDIRYPLGNPELSPDKEKMLRRGILKVALEAMTTRIEKQTVFWHKFVKRYEAAPT